MKIKIKIDNDKCKNPDECMKCVQACPAKIFVLKSVKKESSYVNKWEVKVLFKDLCNGCMKCVEICPEQCISVKF
ncbi:MAG: 4Fe-4S dicluster domain-containing protein [Methanophagales archaeon]|nr:4Fe-4S dicluster domain-containing protein [Methanophagales archaeon]